MITQKTKEIARILKVQPFEDYWKENPHKSLRAAMREWEDFVFEIYFQAKNAN